ncbi:cytochrome P450 [Seiridium cupressi]
MERLHDLIDGALLLPAVWWGVLAIVPALIVVLTCLYRLSPVHPLSGIPGPLVGRVTDLALVYHSYVGDEASYVHSLHERYGPCVRLGPNSVDFTNTAALQSIYLHKSGFAKPDYYNNFDVDGHATIFSNTSHAARTARAKLVLPMFSTASIRLNTAPFTDGIRRYVTLFQERKRGGKANALDLARSLSIDQVTEYLFGIRYGALSDSVEAEKAAQSKIKDGSTMSASAIVDNFIATGRLWYLPVGLYNWVDWLDAIVFPNPSLGMSHKIVDDYVNRVVDAAAVEAEQSGRPSALTTYPCRLLLAGFPAPEVRAQCKDVIYAATDTTGMNLATLCFLLAKHPDVYEKVHTEVLGATITKHEDIQQLPVLNGVVREALRLSMANPCRIPREVPVGGWHFEGRYYPAGTIVSGSAREIHFSDNVYESPTEFKPERWEKSSDEMNRFMMAFGLGARQCIARTLAMYQLYCAAFELLKSDVLRGARPKSDRIEIKEAFNSKVIGGSIDLIWE